MLCHSSRCPGTATLPLGLFSSVPTDIRVRAKLTLDYSASKNPFSASANSSAKSLLIDAPLWRQGHGGGALN